jgi:hypothetical protein
MQNSHLNNNIERGIVRELKDFERDMEKIKRKQEETKFDNK